MAVAAGALAGCQSVARSTGFATEAPQRPDFIAQTRPATLEYVPVGTAAPERTKPKTADEVKRAEAELEALRKRHAAQAGAAPRAKTPTN